MSTNEPMIYGGIYHIENGYANWQGGYLDANGKYPGHKYAVSTFRSPDRANQDTGSWKIRSATGKADGTPVLYNDVFHLENLYKGNGGYLNVLVARGNQYDVSTSDQSNTGSTSWKILSATGKANGTPVLYTEAFYLQNQYPNGSGGYLDVLVPRGIKYDVSISDNSNRDNGSGSWRFVKGKRSPIITSPIITPDPKLPEPTNSKLEVVTNSSTGVEFTNSSSATVSYKFTPFGTWKPKADIPDCTAAGLNGFPPNLKTPYSEALKPYQQSLKYPNNTTFALLAVNKTTGAVTEVSQETTIVLKAGEKLTFLVNDYTPDYGDNTGTLTVTCSVI